MFEDIDQRLRDILISVNETLDYIGTSVSTPITNAFNWLKNIFYGDDPSYDAVLATSYGVPWVNGGVKPAAPINSYAIVKSTKDVKTVNHNKYSKSNNFDLYRVKTLYLSRNFSSDYFLDVGRSELYHQNYWLDKLFVDGLGYIWFDEIIFIGESYEGSAITQQIANIDRGLQNATSDLYNTTNFLFDDLFDGQRGFLSYLVKNIDDNKKLIDGVLNNANEIVSTKINDAIEANNDAINRFLWPASSNYDINFDTLDDDIKNTAKYVLAAVDVAVKNASDNLSLSETKLTNQIKDLNNNLTEKIDLTDKSIKSTINDTEIRINDVINATIGAINATMAANSSAVAKQIGDLEQGRITTMEQELIKLKQEIQKLIDINDDNRLDIDDIKDGLVKLLQNPAIIIAIINAVQGNIKLEDILRLKNFIVNILK